MEIKHSRGVITVDKIQFKNFPHLKTFFYKNDSNKRRHARPETYNDYDYWRITIFLGTNNHLVAIWDGYDVFVGINTLLKKIKEDDGLLAEFFVLRTLGLKY